MMNITQHTIKKSVSVSGTGLHTGNETTVTFKPAEPNYGIKFKRVDLPEQPVIPANIDHVVDITRGTTIGLNGHKIHTVEHVLAALAGLQIDNALVEINSNEPPVHDGSALTYLNILKDAEPIDQGISREFVELESPFHYEKGDIAVGIFPANDLRITFMIDYAHPSLGAQHTTMFDISEFEKEFASARTFCFLSEIKELREKGLIRGGNLDCAVVVVDKEVDEKEIGYLSNLFDLKQKMVIGNTGFVNNVNLRYKNELCRHKALDMLGDLSLLGAPLKAHVLAARSGHAVNVEITRILKKKHLDLKKKREEERLRVIPPEIDVNKILKTLPHRYPFLLVDRVIELIPRKKIIALKNVTINEPYFQGHFPGFPIMPGVLQIEALAQAGGILAMYELAEKDNKLIFFMGIEKAKFRKPVLPGDQLMLHCEIVRVKGRVCHINGVAKVNDQIVSEAELLAAIVDKK